MTTVDAIRIARPLMHNICQTLNHTVVLAVWNDVHFWLNHRLLHLPWLRRFHGAHHRSMVTTPFATYSFHPVEALLLGNVILPPMLVHDFSFWSLASLPVVRMIWPTAW